MQTYSSDIEQQMQRYYQSLSEKERRRYAAIEAVKLGYGGISYMVNLLGCGSLKETASPLTRKANYPVER